MNSTVYSRYVRAQLLMMSLYHYQLLTNGSEGSNNVTIPCFQAYEVGLCTRLSLDKLCSLTMLYNVIISLEGFIVNTINTYYCYNIK